MALIDDVLESNYQAAEYRIRLFLSVDLSGSTAFKDSPAGVDRDGGATPRWVTVFQRFYTDFPAKYAGNYQRLRNELSGNDQCPTLWKAVGDELIFCGRTTNKRSISVALVSFIQTLHDYRKDIFSENTDLNLKGAAWLAAFPEPNRAVQLRKANGGPDLLTASEALEEAADKRPFDYDFLGKAIDTGFRVASTAKPQRFSLSVQLARLLTSAPRGLGNDYDIHIDQPILLKGVNGGEPYPILYIETLDHLGLSDIRRRERRILNRPPSREDLAEYLMHYCNAVGTDDIVLPNDVGTDAAGPPESYLKHRELISEHLHQERGREFLGIGDAIGEEPPVGSDEIVLPENLTPLPD